MSVMNDKKIKILSVCNHPGVGGKKGSLKTVSKNAVFNKSFSVYFKICICTCFLFLSYEEPTYGTVL